MKNKANLDPPGVETRARQDLIRRLEARARLEDNPVDDYDNLPLITWDELRDIAALLREAARALAVDPAVPGEPEKLHEETNE